MSPEDYSGHLAISWTTGYRTAYTVHRADPRVMISVEWVEEATHNPAKPVCLDGDVLQIRADNQTVIYRLVQQITDAESGETAYLAEWPD